MNYDALFRSELDALKKEGNYRVFANWSATPATFPAPGATAAAPRATSPSGARTTISAWASTPP
jgi:hypothetical protein